MTFYLPDNYGPPPPGVVSLVATGSTTADALLLPAQINVFGTVAAGTGCILPLAQAMITIINEGANALLLYPSPGDKFSGSTNDTPISIPPRGMITVARFGSVLIAAGTRRWYVVSSDFLSASLQASTTYADDAAAAAGGVAIGQFYRNGSVDQIRIS